MASFESAQIIIERKLQKKLLKDANLIGVIQCMVGDLGKVVSVSNGVVKLRASNQLDGYELLTRQNDLLKQIQAQQTNYQIHKIKIVVEE